MLKVGLTGGIASGKSAVAQILAELGASVIDTDDLAREVVTPDSAGLRSVVAAFGTDILQADGTLDRSALRQLVFADTEARKQLEAILHPLIRALAVERMATAAGPYTVAVVPLLVESDFAELVDRIAVVDCAPEQQLARVMNRDAVTELEAKRIIGAQASRARRLEVADDIIDNNGDRADLRAAVAALHEQYLQIARGLQP